MQRGNGGLATDEWLPSATDKVVCGAGQRGFARDDAAYYIAVLWDKLVGVKPDNAGSAAAMQQVADWLEKLGLGQYAQRFAENDISFSVLPDLTDQDLKEIGVSLGHRRQLLREIANLGQSAVAPASAPSVTAP